MAFDVEQFRSRMVYDGARPNLFEVQLRFPQFITSLLPEASIATDQIRFMANASQLPPSSLGVARQSYFGREVKFPGDRVFPDWSINVVNDESFAIRDAFEAWSDAINSHSSIYRNPNAINSGGYAVDARIHQFGKGDPSIPIKTYYFVGLFPVQVDPITVAWNANDQIEEFGVTFSYQYWEARSTT